jgi:hypothetical protein
MKYDFLEQRITRFYIDLVAPFAPTPGIDAHSQEEFQSE